MADEEETVDDPEAGFSEEAEVDLVEELGDDEEIDLGLESREME